MIQSHKWDCHTSHPSHLGYPKDTKTHHQSNVVHIRWHHQPLTRTPRHHHKVAHRNEPCSVMATVLVQAWAQVWAPDLELVLDEALGSAEVSEQVWALEMVEVNHKHTELLPRKSPS